MRNHPAGLPFLFLTEMWERFGYYLMIGIFFLYLTDSETGGFGMDNKNAADIYGTFIALVYVTPFIGGLLADRVLGYRLSIIIGGSLMGLGYLTLAIPNNYTTFYLSLGLMIIGNGFFKPNISVLLGNLYNEPTYAQLKDTGYNIFYMGINIGAFVCNFVAAWLRNSYGWGYAFAAAGIGMFIGVTVFLIGMPKYKHADVKREPRPGDSSVGLMLGSVLLPAIVTGLLAWQIPGNIFGSDSSDAFLFGALPIVGFFLWILWKADPEDKRPITALLTIYAIVIAFWAVFKQNGTALTTWAEFYTDRSISESFEGVARGIGMVQEISTDEDYYPVYDQQFRKKMDADTTVLALGKDPYLLNVSSGQDLPEGQTIELVSTEIYQSINPFFVIIFTPLVIAFFAFLRRRKREPSTPAKIGWGMVISAASSLVMVWACIACHNGDIKATSWWLIGTYAVVTIGELFLSPMGLAMVSKIAPRHLTGLMMGGWQMATALGNKLSGVLAEMWDTYDQKYLFFLVNVVLLMMAAGVLFSLMRWLNGIFREKGLL